MGGDDVVQCRLELRRFTKQFSALCQCPPVPIERWLDPEPQAAVKEHRRGEPKFDASPPAAHGRPAGKVTSRDSPARAFSSDRRGGWRPLMPAVPSSSPSLPELRRGRFVRHRFGPSASGTLAFISGGTAVREAAARARRAASGCWQHATTALVALAISACAPLSDEVFVPLAYGASAVLIR
jgi:hypothetical protein